MSRDIFVLSGGGSRGAAQIGMLRALLGAGITPDVLVGGSVGAINACVIGVDPTPQRIETLADRWMAMSGKDLTGSKHSILVNLARRRPYLFSADRLRRLVGDWLDVERLEEMRVPVRIATTHLHTGVATHHDTGVISDLIAASAALPAVFPPVLLDTGHGLAPHVDAGIAENVPLSGAASIARPGDRIWVLDVTKTPTARNLRTPLDVLIAALVATCRNQAQTAFGPGIEVIPVKLDETFRCGAVFDFSSTGALFLLGEQTALAALNARAAVA